MRSLMIKSLKSGQVIDQVDNATVDTVDFQYQPTFVKISVDE